MLAQPLEGIVDSEETFDDVVTQMWLFLKSIHSDYTSGTQHPASLPEASVIAIAESTMRCAGLVDECVAAGQ